MLELYPNNELLLLLLLHLQSFSYFSVTIHNLFQKNETFDQEFKAQIMGRLLVIYVNLL